MIWFDSDLDIADSAHHWCMQCGGTNFGTVQYPEMNTPSQNCTLAPVYSVQISTVHLGTQWCTLPVMYTPCNIHSSDASPSTVHIPQWFTLPVPFSAVHIPSTPSQWCTTLLRGPPLFMAWGGEATNMWGVWQICNTLFWGMCKVLAALHQREVYTLPPPSTVVSTQDKYYTALKLYITRSQDMYINV